MTILGILDKYNEPDLKNIGYEDIIMDLNCKHPTPILAV